MRIQQEDKEFSPIAIVLETKEETMIFWEMLDRVHSCSDSDEEYAMAKKISDWLSNKARL